MLLSVSYMSYLSLFVEWIFILYYCWKSLCMSTTLCMSTLKFTMLNKVKSALILTNVGQRRKMLLFSMSSFITLINMEATLWMWLFSSWKDIFELQKKMTHLINNTCFWFWSIKKKGKHRTYNVKRKAF